VHDPQSSFPRASEADIVVEVTSLLIASDLELRGIEGKRAFVLGFELPNPYHFVVGDSIQDNRAVWIDHQSSLSDLSLLILQLRSGAA